jgi:hypothetical protein
MQRDENRYARLLAAFRAGASVEAAHKSAGCSWRTAKNALVKGIDGRLPIRQVLEEERQNRRALALDVSSEITAQRDATKVELTSLADGIRAECRALAKSAEAEMRQGLERFRERVRIDAADTVEAEIAMVRGGRSLVLSLLDLGQKLQDSGAIGRLGEKILTGLEDGSLGSKAAASLVGSLAKYAKDVSDASRLVIENERRIAGDPTRIVEHRVESTPMTRVELRAAAAEALRILKQVEEYDEPLPENEEPAQLEPPAEPETTQPPSAGLPFSS